MTDDRAAILALRRERRKAKKAKGKEFKKQKRQQKEDKRKEVLAKIRAKKEEQENLKNGIGNGCWVCGQSDHRKQDCPKRGEEDASKTCFRCRRRGHTSATCPQSSSSAGDANSNLCFNCGSNDHRLRDCPNPRKNNGTSYATCFVCNEQGHLSNQCPQSTTGIYPKGGSCKMCGSVLHLAKDCPSTKINADGQIGGERKNTKKTFGDDDSIDHPAEGSTESEPVKKATYVKF